MNVQMEHQFSSKEKVRTNVVDIEEKYTRLKLIIFKKAYFELNMC